MVDTPMPLTAHLAELRSRLIWCMVALAVGFIVCYGFSDKIVAALQSPVVLVGQPVRVPLQIIAPAEAFITYIKVGLIAGLFLVLPFILYQLWRFVAPGLLEHEKKYTVPFLIGSNTRRSTPCRFLLARPCSSTVVGSSSISSSPLSCIFSSALPKATSKPSSR